MRRTAGRLNERVAEINDPTKGSEFHYALYQQVVGPFLGPTLAACVAESRTTTPRDLFIWSLIVGEEALARLMWVRCAKPVHMALLGAHMCARMAKGQAGAGLLKRAQDQERRVEQWALGAPAGLDPTTCGLRHSPTPNLFRDSHHQYCVRQSLQDLNRPLQA